jgi:hypothetical protein
MPGPSMVGLIGAPYRLIRILRALTTGHRSDGRVRPSLSLLQVYFAVARVRCRMLHRG